MDKDTLIIRIVEGFVIFSIIYIFIFYMLKTAGIINTPLIIKLSPQIFALLSCILILFGLFEFFVQIKNLPKDQKKLIKRVDRMGAGLTKLEKNVELIKKDVDFLKTDLSTVKNDVKYLMKCKNYRIT